MEDKPAEVVDKTVINEEMCSCASLNNLLKKI